MLLDLLEAAGNATSKTSPNPLRSAADLRTADLGLAFNRTNPEAVIWSQQHAAELISAIDNITRQTINNIITRSFVSGIAPRESAKLILATLNLNEAQALAVANLVDRMKDPRSYGKVLKAGGMNFKVPAKGPSVELLEKVSTKYGERLLRKRAETIAINETMTVANEGQRQLWNQSVDKGLLSPYAIREWITTPDDRTCPVCRPLDRRTAPLNGPFEGTMFMGPPAHVLCRCAQAISRAPAR